MKDVSGYQFKPHEYPTLPGSPANPDHPEIRRYFYLLIGILVGITAGLGSALVLVNLAYAQGTLGLDPTEAAWLTAAYYMTNTTANLLLVKYRQEFGLQPFVRWILLIYAVAAALHLLSEGPWTAVALRAVSGFAGSGLTTITVLYIMQGMTPAKRLHGIMVGICVPQMATPLARVISPSLLESGDWHMLNWFEMGLVLATLAAIMALPLPPSQRVKSFEKLDFLTIGLLVPGMGLLIAVLSLGRIEWWTEQAWIGWAIVGSLVLVVSAMIVEHYRANPLINTRWLGTRQMLRLAFAAAVVRILLSEQAFGSVGLLSAVGLMNDQMIALNVIIILASIAGMLTAVKTLNPHKLARPITVAIALIAIAAFMDSSSTNLTRPSSFYLSQAMIGFASFLFLSQAMVIGVARTLLAGPRNFISFIMLFSLSQSIGGLAGSTLLSTFQVFREKVHSHELVQNIVMTDPQVLQRLRSGAGAVSKVVGDQALQRAEGAALLARAVAREANILAFNDVFMLIGVLAVLGVIWGIMVSRSIRKRGETSPLVLLQQAMMAQAAKAKEAAAKTAANAAIYEPKVQ